MERMTKDKLKQMDSPKEVSVVEDAKPLIDPKTGKEVSEVYERNKDVLLKFGEKDGNVVIRSITVPGHYDNTVVRNMVDYGKKNIGNCPICDKHKKFLQDTQKKIGIRKFGESWVVDLDPSKEGDIRRVKNVKDVALGLSLNEKKQLQVKKVSFPADKYSREEALAKAREAQRLAVRRVERPILKKEPAPMNPPRKIDPRPRKVGFFPNVVDWRKNRRKMVRN